MISSRVRRLAAEPVLNTLAMDLGKLHILASRFREAIEACDPKHLTIGLEDFPRGSCGDASLLLGTYLREHGRGDFTYILAERREGDSWFSHAWVEIDGVLVDITADQFPEIDERVIVCRDSAWHRRFEIEPRGVADFRVYDTRTVAFLGQAYLAICARLSPNSAITQGTE